MKVAATVVTLIVTSSVLSFAEGSKTYVGVITDTMCRTNHKPMKISPDAKCVQECVRDGKTTTRTGLLVKAALDTNHYDTAIQVSDADLAQLQITPHDFHGDWNYTITPHR